MGFLAAAASLALAAPASAATLSAGVSPTTVTVSKTFKVTLNGVGDNVTDVQQRVVVWTQPKTPGCSSNANAEFAKLRGKNPIIFRDISAGPFRIQKSIRANVLGKRRVCAYLYDQGSASNTLAFGTATYKVVLPLCHRGQTRGCRRH
jgi:hypothetical protein